MEHLGEDGSTPVRMAQIGTSYNVFIPDTWMEHLAEDGSTPSI